MFLKLFLIAHFVLWTLVGLVRKSVAMDTAEAMVWGSEWTLGTNKHPYLSGWVAEAFRELFPFSPRFAAAVLAALCTTLGIWFVYLLAKRFVERERAVFAAVSLEGCVYYSVCALEYNCNMLSVALVPLFFIAFHSSLYPSPSASRARMMWSWFAAGVLAGLLIVTKYTNGIFLLSAALFYLGYLIYGNSRGSEEFFFGPFVALVPFSVIVFPHVRYLLDTDFACFSYLYGRASVEEVSFFSHILNPLKFLLAQIVNCWLPVAVFVWGAVRSARNYEDPLKGESAERLFLWLTGVGPVLVMLVISAYTGMELKSMWGFAFVSVVPVLVVSYVRVPPFLVRHFRSVVFALLAVQAAGLAVVNGVHASSRTSLDVPGFYAELPQADYAFVGGDIWLASELAITLPSRPRVVIDMDTEKVCPWISDKEVRAKGCLVVAEKKELFADYRRRYPGLPEPTGVPLELKSYFSKVKHRTAYYSVLKGTGD